MRPSDKSLLTISLVWGGACLSQVYCAPISHDPVTSGSDTQLAKLKHPDETSPLEGSIVGTTMSIPEKPTEIDIHVLPSASVTNGAPNTPSDYDGGGMFKFWFDVYIEFLKWLGNVCMWVWQKIVPLVLFLAACVATIFLGIGFVALILGLLAAVVVDVPTERTRLL
ncbi:hypothetical protein L211DRAFT_850749 [Terfezia boudieri ATCC MYA-4762]|uniref:Uncharacterized protein n=1 Tax=Terfezia boudieri ATCC MYA-4762 TaxID=1051890 RepID=A0A3N4LH14_9PEZI|nr:hypothetical protein L211DRAFT_850749 [Terfezia boudieri ATCC MYA-4762]